MVKMKNWVKHPTSLVIDLDAARASRERQAAHWAEQSAPKPKKKKKRNKKRRVAVVQRPKEKSKIPAFFNTREWLEIRYQVLKRDGARCACCGVTPADGAVMNVDHIKPRWKYPDLALEPDNLQVLCARCNRGKGGRDKTDWRKERFQEPSLAVVMGEKVS